jgi:transposase, IS30 family
MNKYTQLTQEERYLIGAQLRVGTSLRVIARELDRHPTTIGREVQRNRTRHDGAYRPEKAHSYARARLRRCRRTPRFSARDYARVARLIRQEWSPEQVSSVLKQTSELSMSVETIYKYIRRDRRAEGTLYRHLRIMPKFGRKRYGRPNSRGVLPGKRHISERPEEVERRKAIGHWEGDTVMGSDMRHCVLTLVERATGYGVIRKLTARNMTEATKAIKHFMARNWRWIKTITFDNGTEFHNYKALEAYFPVKCYFATPYHSWERGSNENFNGLLRQYLPKGMCMRGVTQAQCDHIANKINTRPRKRYGYKTPKELYAAS